VSWGFPLTGATGATGAAGAAGASGIVLQPTAVKTSAYNAVANDFVPVDTTSGNVTITLPTAPADTTQVGVKQVIRGGTNTVTVACGGTDTINRTSGSTSRVITLNGESLVLQYKASGGIWYIVATDLPYASLLANAQTWTGIQTLTTPVLGVATGTSLAIGGATIGSNALAVTGTAAITPAANSLALNISGASVTSTNTIGAVAISGTLNGTGLTNFVNIAATVTATDANTRILSVNGGASGTTEMLAVVKTGNVVLPAATLLVDGGGVRIANTGQFYWANRSAFGSSADGNFQLMNNSNSITTFLSVPVSATLQLGAAAAASPVAQTLTAQSVASGTSNTSAPNLTIDAPVGTGTGAGGSFIVRVAPAGTTGTSQNSLAAALTIDSTKLATFAGALSMTNLTASGTIKLGSFTVAGLPSAATSGAGATAFVTDASTTLVLGLGLAVSGGGSNKVPVYSDGASWLYG
jgi:hypothetical protein